MQLIWVLPSLIFGAYMGLSSGSWLLLAMSLGSGMLALVSARVRYFQQVDFSQPIEFFENRFWVGSKKLPLLRFFWRREWNQHFYRYFELTKATQNPGQPLGERPEFADPGPLSALLGYSNFLPLIASFERHGAHLLIIGPTGSGKSVLLKQIAASLASGSASAEASFVFIDFKGNATFAHLAGTRVLLAASDLDLDSAKSALGRIALEINHREGLLSKLGLSNFQAAQLSGHRLPALFIFIDELGALLKACNNSAAILESVASKGRSLGIFIVAANQTTLGIPRTIQLNLRQRIALAGADPLELHQLGFKARLPDANRPQQNLLFGSWINAVGESQQFTFHSDFDLEKTFINRHFSG